MPDLGRGLRGLRGLMGLMGRQGEGVTRRRGDKERGRQGEGVTRRGGDRERGRGGDKRRVDFSRIHNLSNMQIMDKKINRFVFNSFGVNTYILSDEAGKCLIVDPGCQYHGEETELLGFITGNHLIPVGLVNTHFHIDHILGNSLVSKTFNLKPQCHRNCKMFWETASEFGSVFGIKVENLIIPENFIEEGDLLAYGSSSVEVLYTPGHADGSICLVNHAERYVISGDVLFRDSIGRTDLPTGNFDLLQNSITTRLFTLPDDYTVFPGHGPETTIGYEKANNPFLH